jgi:rod shape-determining protein MreB
MLTKNVFGVDLGTSAVKIYSLRKNRLMAEKDMIALRNGTQVIAVGNDAFEMFEKNPPNVVIDRPIVNGKIADVDEVEMMLRLLLKRTDKHVGRKPIIYFSVPVNMSEIEKRAYYAICYNSSFQSPKIFLVDRPICDALALGIPLSRTRGSMILSIGAQSTKMSVLSNEQIMISNSIPVGGQQLNEAICEDLRRTQNLLIGTRTARRLKAVLTNLDRPRDEARKVFGIDTLSGLPKEAVISSALISRIVEREVVKEAETVRSFLERIPPQVGRSVREEGIFLTGGTARIPGIDRCLSKIIGCKINLSGNYELCTVKGLEEIIKHKELRKWAYTIKDKK